MKKLKSLFFTVFTYLYNDKVEVALFGTHRSPVNIKLPVLGSPGGQAIHIAIEHTKSSGDQNGIMYLFISRP